MELVSFVAENAMTGVFGGMGVATLSIFAPRFFRWRFNSKVALPSATRLLIQEQLDDYEATLRDAENECKLLETDFALAFPETPFSTLKLDMTFMKLQSTHKSLVVHPVRSLFGSTLKEKEQEVEIQKVLNLLEANSSLAHNNLSKIKAKQSVVATQATARSQMVEELSKMVAYVEESKEKMKTLSKQFDPLYLANVPEYIHAAEKKIDAAQTLFSKNRGKFFNNSDAIREANEIFEVAAKAYNELKIDFEKLTNFQQIAMEQTQPLKKVLNMKDATTPDEVRMKNAALEALYLAQTHEYTSGSPAKVMREILAPVYEFLEAR